MRWMRLAAAVVATMGLAQTGWSDPPSKNYALVWSDEFDGAQLDASKWGYHSLGKRRQAMNVKECATLDGKGNLLITTRKVGDVYQTAMIETRGKFEATFGYFEARMKFQTQEGHWSAFWMMPRAMRVGDVRANGAEIDIIEFLGKKRDTMLMNLHWDGYGKDHKSTGSKHVDPSLAEGFHVVGLEWTPAEYIFFLDGKEVWRTDKAVSHAPEYLILSLEIDKWGGDISKAALPDHLIVDYVRAYQKRPDAK